MIELTPNKEAFILEKTEEFYVRYIEGATTVFNGTDPSCGILFTSSIFDKGVREVYAGKVNGWDLDEDQKSTIIRAFIRAFNASPLGLTARTNPCNEKVKNKSTVDFMFQFTSTIKASYDPNIDDASFAPIFQFDGP